ncbi:hypothetical protein DPEC_G00023060 [Dallia pectoralis]|uniref:Uncharacterized protein n=1 Tax=Dallia pectoralis TaxID=75939 RepID=A0ACC2HHJ1_DALPE|nr:hypothetical protein DPEC_G00023060 [Dallia pectoralis]
MEHIRLPKVENVRLIDTISSRRASVGTLYLTATHTIFVDKDVEILSETWVLHSLVSSVDKQASTTTGCPLLVRCKNFQVLQFIIPLERDCHDVHVSLLRLSRPEQYEELYCFSYDANSDREEREKAWDFLNLKSEYSRMGLPNRLWRLSPINHHYKVSDTYPADLYVPKSATPQVIVGSSKFRSRGRLPTLSYYYRENHAAICRSSQPLSGFSARCLEDEKMLEAIVRSNPQSDFMYVVDTRPKLNAMANRAAGKGYENEDNYSNIKFHFVGIENIHVMRSSLHKMLQASEAQFPSMSYFLGGLESSGWLKHIKAILDAGVFIAKAIAEEGISVLVHCSDGWDRTAQVCSVASVLLDPYYRTVKGLMVLIERDWISFGHKFSHRLQMKTHSLWTNLWENRSEYINPLYRPDHSQTQGVLRPLTAPYCFKFWAALYNRFDRGMFPRQSVMDYIMAIREDTQQLEDQLVSHKMKILNVEKQQTKNIHMNTNMMDRSPAVWASPPSDSTVGLANTPENDSGQEGFRTSSPCQQKVRESSLQILSWPQELGKPSNPDLSTNSADQESGIAGFSCRSPPSEDSAKDPDSDETAYSAA